MSGIKPIQPNNIYRVNPINFFENRQKQDFASYNYNANMFSKNDGYNLNYPKHSGSENKAKFLDLLA